MGNIVASAKSAPPPDDFSLTPEFGLVSEDSKKDAPPVKEESDSSKVGSFEELPRKTKEVLAKPFEGCKFTWNKMITDRFQATHTINMSSFKPASYKFGTTYVGAKKLGPNEQYPILISEYGGGMIQFQGIHSFTSEIQAKAVVHATDKSFSMYQADIGYKGEDVSAQITGVNASIINPQGIWVGHYLQRISKHLSLGGELMFQHGMGAKAAFITYGGMYKDDKSEFVVKTGEQGTHLCYYNKGNEQVECGVEFEYVKQMGESVTTFGYSIDLPKGLSRFKGSIDTDWSVTGVLEKRFEAFPFCFSLSGLLNHKKNQAKFGIGFTIG